MNNFLLFPKSIVNWLNSGEAEFNQYTRECWRHFLNSCLPLPMKLAIPLNGIRTRFSAF